MSETAKGCITCRANHHGPYLCVCRCHLTMRDAERNWLERIYNDAFVALEMGQDEQAVRSEAEAAIADFIKATRAQRDNEL